MLVSMKIAKSIILLLCAIFAFGCNCNAVDAREAFKSPDGRYTLKFISDPDDVSAISSLAIVDNTTGQIFRDSTVMPILLVKWTGDSKTVVIVVHVSGGSEAIVYHLKKDNEWVNFNIEPSMGDAFSVVYVNPKKNTIDFRYKVHKKTTGDMYLYSFTFHPDSFTQTNIKTVEIDDPTYRSLDLKVENSHAK